MECSGQEEQGHGRPRDQPGALVQTLSKADPGWLPVRALGMKKEKQF